MAEETIHERPTGAEPEVKDIVEETEEEGEQEVTTSPRWSPLRRAILYIFLGIGCALIFSYLREKAIERQNKVVYAKR